MQDAAFSTGSLVCETRRTPIVRTGYGAPSTSHRSGEIMPAGVRWLSFDVAAISTSLHGDD